MLLRLRRAISRSLPEPTLDRIVRARHGETAPQLRLHRAHGRLRAAGRGPQQAGHVRVLGFDGGVEARIVDSVDAHAVRSANVEAVSECLARAGLAHALVPSTLGRTAVVALSVSDRPAALQALATGLGGPQWCVDDLPAVRPQARARYAGKSVAATRLGAGRWREPARFRVFQVLATAAAEVVAGPELSAAVEFWHPVGSSPVPRPDGGDFTPGTLVAPEPLTTVVAYLSPGAWAAAVASPGHWLTGRPRLTQVREPIDIVYTWVDGSDPVWLARKAACGAAVDAETLNRSATHDSRFSSRDELRYSLRSVAQYAGWARRIYIVTDQQVPGWLNVDHPQVEVVDHRQIFRDPAGLPVFNSHAIESQLHHIDGLAERYVYLNDDVFFGRLVEPETFFHGNGIARFFLSNARLDVDPPSSQDLPVMSAAKRNRELIEARFGATVVNKFKHTPHPQLRSVLEQLELEHPEAFAAVARSRFRHPDDLSITSALHHYYAYGLGRALPGAIRYVYQDIARADTPRRLHNLLRLRDADVFCLNDHESDPAGAAELTRLLGEFLARMYPLPSPFERSDG
ncbi:stealth family protein [Jatrophihabitans sp.]|uniref:stealth family protein n=1 Tax=Jatrophihabitans sp. TaxID=1932789 RepID=UPI0030C68741|nr:Exopolysaccharide phosphotransferase [Jatrophihabitans sp.]